jgi:hypothetical protein
MGYRRRGAVRSGRRPRYRRAVPRRPSTVLLDQPLGVDARSSPRGPLRGGGIIPDRMDPAQWSRSRPDQVWGFSGRSRPRVSRAGSVRSVRRPVSPRGSAAFGTFVDYPDGWAVWGILPRAGSVGRWATNRPGSSDPLGPGPEPLGSAPRGHPGRFRPGPIGRPARRDRPGPGPICIRRSHRAPVPRRPPGASRGAESKIRIASAGSSRPIARAKAPAPAGFPAKARGPRPSGAIPDGGSEGFVLFPGVSNPKNATLWESSSSQQRQAAPSITASHAKIGMPRP